MQQVRKRRRRKYAAPIGGIFVVLAVIGALTIVVSSISLTSTVLDNSAAKAELEEIIRPVMMFAPLPFENPADIPEEDLLMYSLFATIYSEKRMSYTYDENGELRIPASDLDVSCARLFGDEITLSHRSFGDYSTYYYYDGANGFYSVPIMADLYVYEPVVESIEREEGDLYNITVGYIPPSNAWTTDFSGSRNKPLPEKYMIYVMRKVRSGYQIVAVRDVDTAPLAGTGPVEQEREADTADPAQPAS